MSDKPDFSQVRVLVIDDESFMRALIVRILSEIGVGDTVTAKNGEEGLELLINMDGAVSVVICDLEMPQMDGFEFVRRLRRSDQRGLSDLPVLIVTGHAEPKNIYNAVDIGIHGYLVKPISRQTLESRIVNALTSTAIDPAQIRRSNGDTKPA